MKILDTIKPINPKYVTALADFITECRNYDIKTEVRPYCNGFIVIFPEIGMGDAICHDGSYGNEQSLWETMGFPWDDEDVSVHESKCLVHMLATLKEGSDWRPFEE